MLAPSQPALPSRFLVGNLLLLSLLVPSAGSCLQAAEHDGWASLGTLLFVTVPVAVAFPGDVSCSHPELQERASQTWAVPRASRLCLIHVCITSS